MAYTLSSVCTRSENTLNPTSQPILQPHDKVAIAVDAFVCTLLVAVVAVTLLNGSVNMGPLTPYLNTIGTTGAYSMLAACGGIIILDSFKYGTQLKKRIQQLTQRLEVQLNNIQQLTQQLEGQGKKHDKRNKPLQREHEYTIFSRPGLKLLVDRT